MSYILEALRRADAERERGAVPGLHSRPVGSTVPAVAGARPLATWAIGVGAGLAVVAVAVVAWRLAAPSPAPAVVLAPGSGTAAATQGAPAPVPAPMPAPAPVVAVAAPPAAPVAPATPPVLSAPVAAAAPADRKVAPVSVAPATAAAPAAPAAAPRIYTPQELPADVQAQLPRLNVSGATYSSNPAYRMVIVSGQVLHEGEQAATGTVLEKIEPHAVVLSFKGYRYTLPY